ncbi:MAG: POTRA domain-containing protein [Bacteroidota bacterium]
MKNQLRLTVVQLLTSLFLVLFISDASAQQSDTVVTDLKVNRIIITGNKVTKQYIIERELIFHEGDSLPEFILDNAIVRSKENLLNTGLFNFADIKKYADASGRVDIHIDLAERWYLWPFPFFEVVDRNFNEWWLTRDFNRTNYGMYLTRENFRGRDESLKLQVRLGYSQRLGLFYNIPYINKQQNLGLTIGAFYTRNREIAYATEGNKLVYYKDPDQFIRKDWTVYGKITRRSGIYDFYSFSFDYRRVDVIDTIISLNKEYFIHPDPMQQQISIGWSYRHDKRNYQPYPLKGHLFDFEVARTGLGFLKNEPEILALASSIRKYYEWAPRWHSSISIKGKISGQSLSPFVNMRALGYGTDAVRGYEYYVINGNNFFLVKSTLIKYTLIPTHIYIIPFLGSQKFNKIPSTIYFSLSADAGYVRDRQFSKDNPLSNTWLTGYSAGIDYVTYYDLVFRFEYSINHLGEHGFFINFAAPF